MGGTFKKLFKGDIGGFFKDVGSGVSKAVQQAAPVLLPLAAGALTGGATNLLSGLGIGKTASGIIGQLVGQMGASALSSAVAPQGVSQQEWDMARQAYQQNPGAFSQTFIPQKGVGMDELIKLYSLFSNDKPEAPKKLEMKDIGGNLAQLPFFSNMQQVVNNNEMKKVGADIAGEKERVLGQPLGWGQNRYNAARQNLEFSLGEQNRKNMNRLNASMANRGLSGGVMTTAQRAAMQDYNDSLQQGLNNLTIGNEDAIRQDRTQQNADVARLLGMSGETASNINNTTMDAFGKMMQGVGSNIDLYNAQLKGYDTDRQAWSDMFGSMAQAGSQFQPAYNPNTGQPVQSFMGSTTPVSDAGKAVGGAINNWMTGKSDPVSGYVNYFSNPNTGAGQKVTDFISNPWGTVKDIWNNNIPTTITATPKFPASTPIQTKTRSVWDQIYGR